MFDGGPAKQAHMRGREAVRTSLLSRTRLVRAASRPRMPPTAAPSNTSRHSRISRISSNSPCALRYSVPPCRSFLRSLRPLRRHQKSICALTLAKRGVSTIVGVSHEPARHERLVVAQHGARVEDVVEIDADVGPRAAEAQHLGHAQIELVDAVAPWSPGASRLTDDVRHAARRRPPERLARRRRRARRSWPRAADPGRCGTCR